MKKRKSKKLGCWRALKRHLSRKVSWNDWSLKTQIFVQLLLLSASFFTVYFTFNIAFTSYELKSQVLKLFSESLLEIDLEKLNLDTISTTVCYQRLEDENEDVLKHVTSIYSDALQYSTSYSLNKISLAD